MSVTGKMELGWIPNMRLGVAAFVFTALLLGYFPAASGADKINESSSLKEIEQRVLSVVRENQKAVVGINGGGSGIIVSANGLVLTAAHVVTFPGNSCFVQFPDGRELRARKLGMNSDRDAAMVKILDEGPFPFAEVRYEPMKPAEWVVAMGHPQGYSERRAPPVRFGRIIKPHRDSLGPLGFMMSDCTITGGDSGGPLFDMEGKVVGIHSFVANSLYENFHVPMEVFQKDWDEMFDGSRWGSLRSMDKRPDNPAEIVEKPHLGVRFDATDNPSTEVIEVIQGSPAEKAGINSRDRILSLNDEEISNYDDIAKFIADQKAGDEVTVRVQRDNSEVDIKVELGKWIGFKAAPDWGGLIDEIEKGWTVPQKFEEAMYDISERAGESTVALMSGDKRLAHGIVLSSDGWILSKASELEAEDDLEALNSEGKKLSLTLMDSVHSLDLALLKADTAGIELLPIEWPSDQQAPKTLGSFVLAPTVTEDEVVYLGVVSVKERPVERDKGFLGVSLQQSGEEVTVVALIPDCPAEKVGIERGDVILEVNNIPVELISEAIQIIGEYEPGERVTFKIRRGEEILTKRVVLGSRVNQMPIAFNMEGGRFSKQRAGFPRVMQHDIPLSPEDCGGPLVDSDGVLAGINIARSSRIRSFALPVQLLMDHLHEDSSGHWHLVKPRKDLEKQLSKAQQDLQDAKKRVVDLQKLINNLDSE